MSALGRICLRVTVAASSATSEAHSSASSRRCVSDAWSPLATSTEYGAEGGFAAGSSSSPRRARSLSSNAVVSSVGRLLAGSQVFAHSPTHSTWYSHFLLVRRLPMMEETCHVPSACRPTTLPHTRSSVSFLSLSAGNLARTVLSFRMCHRLCAAPKPVKASKTLE
eukprot:scaffold72755_cov92-Phaeocystis_antarctica.AAC.5